MRFIYMILVLAMLPAFAGEVLVETEAFDNLGGWVPDSQFMDEMGSPFLLAHGLGKPVDDASTKVTFPETGTYQVWVRTRDWVAPWKTPDTAPAKRAKGTPGIFKVLIDGKPLPNTFGQKSAEWYWEPAGTVNITKKSVKISLHDLTGFEGRCDAILFSTHHDLVPPSTGKPMAQFRRKLLGLPEVAPNAGNYDLVVTGGGIAGISAAVSGARSGLKVALIQDRPVLGGNNSSEVRVWLQGANKGSRYPNLGLVVRELEQKKRAHYGPSNTADLYEDEKKIAIVKAEKNLSLFLNFRANEVETTDGKINAVIAQNTTTAKRLRFPGRWFADCTGDGCIGFLSKADFDITINGHMGRCNLWNIKDTGKPVSFPRCPWALDLTDHPFPGRGGRGGIKKLGGWYWESGCFCDPFAKSEYIRDWNFRAMYGAVDCLKNVDKVYPNHKLNWSAYISGKRESRRLLGDLILAKVHLLGKKKEGAAIELNDGCVVTGWKIDLHLPDPKYEKGFEGDGFITKASFTKYPTPFYIPYRCLYSRNIGNLFMAGRCVSVTHNALGTVRVMRTGGLMGEVVGIAAALCKDKETTPRGVYKEHLDELKERLKRGVPKGD